MDKNPDATHYTGNEETPEGSNYSIYHPTNGLRWVVDSINERYLQQAWINEKGDISWENIDSVTDPKSP